ncbi:MAG: ShlB/FhaC/HecB family hemolysin secretion/activation protein [Nitrospira sp.]|nr:ShlB/FhaC/HecB family hemolysin secretion/activation protein [Nitrospira sp.]
MTDAVGGGVRWTTGRPIARALFSVGCIMMGLTTPSPLFAQTAPPIFDPAGRSGAAPLKKEFAPPLLPPNPVLPPVPQPSDSGSPQQLDQVRVFVDHIQVEGSTVFSEADLDAVTKPYRHRSLTTEDLEQVRLALTLLYVNHGYITSGAVIPDQDVEGGVITIRIIEGALTRTEVEGTRWFRPGYISDRLALGASTPLRLERIQERLQLLQRDPRIERINAELRPGEQRGESVLAVKVQEARPWKVWLDFNNYQTPTVGAERGLITLAHHNVTGHGDIFSFTSGGSRGVHPIIDTFYTLPLNRHDTTFTAAYRRNEFIVISDAFRALNVESESEIIGFTLRHPVYRTLSDELAVAVTGEHLYSKVTSAFDMPGQPSLFIPGASDTGVSTVNALRFVQEYQHRTPSSVIAARSRFSVGFDVLGATIHSRDERTQDGNALPSGRFFSWLGQIQAVKRLDRLWGVQILGRVDLQLSNNRLFPLEQIPVGGRFSVRGYRENTLIRDNAFLASLETRIPLLRFASGEEMLQFAQFVDLGHAWVSRGNTPDPQTLASVGLGLRWNVLPRERARFELYWGVPLNHVPHPSGNLQDYGIHLQAVVQAW